MDYALANPTIAAGLNWRGRHQAKSILGALGLRRYAPWERAITFMAGLSEVIAEKALGHAFAKTTWTKPEKVFLALTTSAVESSSTGESIEASEATYTGYVRLELDPTKLKVTKAATSKIENELELSFAACTGSEKTVIGWAVPEKKRGEACNIIAYGTCTSVVISTTQTPPVVAAKKLEVTLK
jgi:hypothetical protein